MRTIVSLLVFVAPAAFGQLVITNNDTPSHPADDKLSCDQIKTELTAIAADPALQGLMAQLQVTGAQAFLALAQHPEIASGLTAGTLGQAVSQVGGPTAGQLAESAAVGALGQGLSQLGGAAAGHAAQNAAVGALGQGALSQIGANAASAAAEQATAHAISAGVEATAQAAEQPKKRGGLFKGIGKGLGGIGGAFGANRGAAAAQAAQVAAMGAAGRAAQAAQQPVLDATAAQIGASSPQLMRGMELAKVAEAHHCGS